MGNFNIYLIVVFSHFFLSFVVSDRLTSYDTKRIVSTGPNPTQSLGPNLVLSRSNDYNIIYDIKRKVLTGPNPEESPDPIPIVVSLNEYKFISQIKRKVPTGPNPEESPDPVPIAQGQIASISFIRSKGKSL